MPPSIETKSEAGALAYWFDIAPDVRDEWLHWYLADHMPSRVGTTFVAGRCYEASNADSSHMVFFETTTPEALLAPAYVALLKQVSDEDRQRRGWYSNTIRVTCRIAAQRGKGVGSVLGVLRITGAKAPATDVRRCLIDELVPLFAHAPRIGSVSLLQNDPELRARIDAVRVTGHQDGSSDWAVLIEAAREDDIEEAWKRLGRNAAWRAMQLGDAAVLGRYRLLYAMTASHPQ